MNSQGASNPVRGQGSLRSSGVTPLGLTSPGSLPVSPLWSCSNSVLTGEPWRADQSSPSGGVPIAPQGFWVTWARPPPCSAPGSSSPLGSGLSTKVLPPGHLQRAEAALHPVAQRPSFVSIYVAVTISYVSICLIYIRQTYICVCICIIHASSVLPVNGAGEALPVEGLASDLKGLMVGG